MTYKYGDMVRHYSQPYPLVVIKQEQDEVEVFWFDPSFNLQTFKFEAKELRKVLGSHYDGDLT